MILYTYKERENMIAIVGLSRGGGQEKENRVNNTEIYCICV
jgi:hypothetical protein